MKKGKTNRVIVIVPTYNEAENIGRMLDGLVGRILPKIKGVDVEVLVVDSRSPDGTANIVREKMKESRKITLLQTDKGGLGADYAKGMRYAMEKMKADAVIEFDADFQHDPKDIPKLIGAYKNGADYVIGSRYVKGGRIPKEWGLHRKAMSFFGSLFARVVFVMPQIHDLTSGMKLTSARYLKRVDLDNLLSKYYAYKIHILHDVVRMGAKTVEIPIIFHERERGSSKISRKDLIDSFVVVVKLRIRDSKRFIKFGIVGFVGYVINATGLEVFFRLGFTPGVAAAIGAELAIISNFSFNNIWTFRRDKITSTRKILYKFFQFNLTSLGAVIIQGLVVGIGTGIFGNQWRQVILVFAVGLFVVPYNYATYNLFIWRTWKIPFQKWQRT